MLSSSGHSGLNTDVLFQGASVIRVCDCGLHPGEVAAPGPCLEGPVQGHDAGEL